MKIETGYIVLHAVRSKTIFNQQLIERGDKLLFHRVFNSDEFGASAPSMFRYRVVPRLLTVRHARPEREWFSLKEIESLAADNTRWRVGKLRDVYV